MFAMAIVLSFVVLSSIRNLIDNEIGTALKVFSLVSCILALILMFQRDTYLPFLGYTALPKSLIKDMIAPANSNVYANIEVKDVPDGTKIIYWGAKPSKLPLPNPWDAYDHYQNAGVTEIRGGKAQLRFHCPATYKVPSGVTLNRHVHYRICYEDGMIGPVETTYVDC